jgi:ubiquinone/menaquinone biosynthesis C-methylase UbiE
MLRQIRAWLTLTQLGPARRVASQVMQYFRYSIIKSLEKEGVYDYLKEPRTYGQILAHFGFVDSDYARELFELLSSEKQNTIIHENGAYRINPAQTVPTLEDLYASTYKHNHSFVLLAEDMARNIPARLRRQPVEFTSAFEEQGREMMQTFDTVLGNRLYTVSRQTAFALLTQEERRWLRSKSLLDIGCGSGRETAEIWLMLKGDVRITAIDPVPNLLERARQNFPAILSALNPNHPPLDDGNLPTFHEASVTRLPFEDNTFDAAFHSHILHWTSDPRRAIAEVVRVLKPGGLVFGIQTCKPYTSMYTDLIFRSNENSYGFFWPEEFRRWYGEHGIQIETATPAGAFRGRKPDGST